ncbi:hypothetical protein HK107_08310 [Parvularcula sp. ZS-1/3]|uniref:Sec-independent protein translocase protein TatA n=1 Tax=Parvularcula mediterranea TaxID=2732508 RepID=A0A7Y3RLJ2_9PROT|nr:twin-arginine translocase TatA/TatE family subunit [Parvularcula mediterranea]NNU16322.1 hypothetical protein [Parvularcula mediterranea]
MFPGWQQLLIVLVLVLILFGGRGRISSLMGDLAKGIKSFRSGLADDGSDEEQPKTALDAKTGETVEVSEKDPAKSE